MEISFILKLVVITAHDYVHYVVVSMVFSVISGTQNSFYCITRCVDLVLFQNIQIFLLFLTEHFLGKILAVSGIFPTNIQLRKRDNPAQHIYPGCC